MSQFQIGQVIYVLSNKTQTVLPGIVLEEIYHKRLDGDSVSYKMAIGPINNRKNVDLAKVDGEIYGSLEEIKNVLLEKVNAFVEDLCEQTSLKAEEWYGTEQTSFINSNMNSDEKIDPSTLLKEVSQIPMQQQQQLPQQQIKKPKAKRNQMVDSELLQRDFVNQDGTVQKISINTEVK